MTKEEAIARIKDHIAVHKYLERGAVHIIEALNMAIKALEREQWIPCSERLPQKGTKAILLYSNGKISGGNYLGERTWDIDYADADLKVSVIAWMPLPQP